MVKQPLSDAVIEEVGKLFGCMGDVSRLKILRVLLDARGALSQGAVAESAGLSQANASKHLAHLVQVGLVLREPHGTQVHFRPVMPIVEDVCRLMSTYVTHRITTAYRSLR
jgi:DNA-binding transcriptional ArsR family regulator